MNRLPVILLSILLTITLGCDDDGHRHTTSTTNATPESSSQSPDGPDYCFPSGLSSPLLETTNSTVSTTTTIGSSGGTYYQQKYVVQDQRRYSDGTTYSADKTTIDETTASSGATNTTTSIDETEAIVFINSTTISSELVEHYTEGVRDLRQFNAFVHCNDGGITAISEDQFSSVKKTLGIN